jgi:hypothetical protein
MKDSLRSLIGIIALSVFASAIHANSADVTALQLLIIEVDQQIADEQSTFVTNLEILSDARIAYADGREEENSSLRVRWNGRRLVHYEYLAGLPPSFPNTQKVMARLEMLYQRRSKLLDELEKSAQLEELATYKVRGLDAQIRFHTAILRQAENAVLRARESYEKVMRRHNSRVLVQAWGDYMNVYGFSESEYYDPKVKKASDTEREVLRAERRLLLRGLAPELACAFELETI